MFQGKKNVFFPHFALNDEREKGRMPLAMLKETGNQKSEVRSQWSV